MANKFRRHWIKLAKQKSTQSSTRSRVSTVSTSAPSLSSEITKAKVVVWLQCYHKLYLDARPNPRKKWPDPQMCPTCKKKMRVVEIHGPRVETTNITAPNAPKHYIKRLKKGLK